MDMTLRTKTLACWSISDSAWSRSSSVAACTKARTALFSLKLSGALACAVRDMQQHHLAQHTNCVFWLKAQSSISCVNCLLAVSQCSIHVGLTLNISLKPGSATLSL